MNKMKNNIELLIVIYLNFNNRLIRTIAYLNSFSFLFEILRER